MITFCGDRVRGPQEMYEAWAKRSAQPVKLWKNLNGPHKEAWFRKFNKEAVKASRAAEATKAAIREAEANVLPAFSGGAINLGAKHKPKENGFRRFFKLSKK